MREAEMAEKKWSIAELAAAAGRALLLYGDNNEERRRTERTFVLTCLGLLLLAVVTDVPPSFLTLIALVGGAAILTMLIGRLQSA
jgi:hypothetical protein